MTKDELSAAGIFADTATFIHGGTYNLMHDRDRVSFYEMKDQGQNFNLVVEIIGAKQMRQAAAALNHAADLSEEYRSANPHG